MRGPAYEQLRRLLLPSSKYSSSMSGQSWEQIFATPLPPYLSFLPFTFRMLAYAAIAPVIILLVLDLGGYIVWRIYDQPFWSGTRTAFYKFAASPVFTKSRNGSPSSNKANNAKLHPFDARHAQASSSTPGSANADADAAGRETSISPISSSASLHEMGMITDTTSPSSPVAGLSAVDLPALAAASEPASGSTRSNSLGLGFEPAGESDDRATPTMFIKSPSPMMANPMEAEKVEPSSTQTSSPSSASSAQLEEDDKAFREAKAAVERGSS